MATTRPPNAPPNPPGFDDYRPSDERTNPPSQSAVQQRQPSPQLQAQWGPYAQHYQNEQAQDPRFAQSNAPPQNPYPQAPPQHYQPQQPYAQPPQGMPPQQRRAGPPGGGGKPPRKPAPPPRRGIFGKIMLGLVVLALLVGGAAAYLILNAPADLVRDRIVAEVKAKTGRDLTITGPASFSVYPNIGVTMQNVSLSPPPGMTGQPLVTMESFDVSVRILPLMKREVYVERIILKKPVFELYSDANGRKSWEFALLEASDLVQFAQAPAPVTDAAPIPVAPAAPAAPVAASPEQDAALAKLGGIQQLHFGNVRIEDGTLRFADAKTGAKHEVSAMNMKVALSDLRQPMNAEGDLVWKGQKVTIDADVTTVHALLSDKPARLVSKISSTPVSADFDGSLSVRDGLDLTGKVNANASSARQLAKWLGSELPNVSGYGPFAAAGQIRATPTSINLADANLVLDGATAKGQVSVDTAGARPYVRAALVVSELNLNKYMAGGAAFLKDAPAATAAPAPAPATPAAKPTEQSINDLLGGDGAPAAAAPPPQPVPAAKVKGYTQRNGWSAEQLDLDGLGAVDTDAKLTVGKLIYQNIKVGQTQLTVALKSKVMKTTFDDIQLYGGRGRGFLTIDASAGKSAATGANLTFDGIDALPLLKDAADFDKLSGKGKLSLAVAGQGANQQQIINSLNGKSEFIFANGAINGLNVAGMVRGISQGKLSGLKTSPTEKTDFSELASSWTITNGIAANQDLRLVSPLLRLGGAGNVMLGDRQVDYMAKPKLVSSLQGQGGAADADQGLEIPVRVHGPWDKVQYTPDLKGILADPNKAIDTVKKLGEQFKGKKAGDIVNDLLGKVQGQTGSSPDGAGQAQKIKPKDLLDQLLKGQ
jgi:AsmA protein